MKKFFIGLCVVCMIFSQCVVAFAFCEHEPNDTHSDAKHGGGYTFGSRNWLDVYGLVSPEDKVDWIRIGTRSKDHRYGDCEISLEVRGNGNYDIDLYMYDENEKLITSSTNPVNEDEEIVGYFMQPDKNYYFKIVHHSGEMPKEPNYRLYIRFDW